MKMFQKASAIGHRVFKTLAVLKDSRFISQVGALSQPGRVRSSTIFVKNPRVLRIWFGSCAGMCALTTVIGGVTRLTESGLSMTDWKFVGDCFLPTNDERWAEEFERYKQYPEWIRLNKDREMNLVEFKFIYFMEYLHRNLGKLTGVVFAGPIPFLWKSLSRAGKRRLGVLGSLLGLQGFLGWYMVKSGLDEDLLGENGHPRVSHYRLAIHLSAAFILYSGFAWSVMDCSPTQICVKNPMLKNLSLAMLALTSSTIVLGALVAGLDAGMIYNTFPLMGNNFVPDDYFGSRYAGKPFMNFLENPSAVQFNHRVAGLSSLAIALVIYGKGRSITSLKPPVTAVLHSTLLQAGLGIFTVLSNVQIWMASSHQAGAIAVVTSILWLLRRIRY